MNLVFQHYALFPHMNVEENILFGLKMKKVAANQQRRRLDEVGFFFFIPLLLVTVLSFMERGTYGQVVHSFTLQNYVRFVDPLYIGIMLDTLVVSVVTTVISLLIGYPLAYYIARMDKKWQHIWLLAVMIPFWINFLVRSYAWVVILRTQGVINTFLLSIGAITEPLPLLYNSGSVMLGMVYTLLPFMILPIYVSLEQLDRRKLEAAYDLGATPLQAFWHVTLPLTKPGMVTGSILVFVSSIGMFVVPDVMGGWNSGSTASLPFLRLFMGDSGLSLHAHRCTDALLV